MAKHRDARSGSGHLHERAQRSGHRVWVGVVGVINDVDTADDLLLEPPLGQAQLAGLCCVRRQALPEDVVRNLGGEPLAIVVGDALLLGEMAPDVGAGSLCGDRDTSPNAAAIVEILAGDFLSR